MIFGELNGCPLQATISLTQSCFLSHRPPFFIFCFTFTACRCQTQAWYTAASLWRHHIIFPLHFCFQVELASTLVNNQWEAPQVPVRLLCFFYGSIICSRTASSALAGSRRPAQGHFSRKDAKVTEAWTWTSSIKESFFPHYSPAPLEQM